MGNSASANNSSQKQPKARRKLLFLDVDGVLNSTVSRERNQAEAFRLSKSITPAQRKREGVKLPKFDDPDPQMVRHLAHIVRTTQAEVVLSSTWRLQEETRKRLLTALEAEEGITVIGDTPNLEREPRFNTRPDEIVAFLEAHGGGVHQWVAVDDLPLVNLDEKCRNGCTGIRLTAAHFVQTSDQVGLTAELAEEAIAKLSAEPP